MHHQRAVRLVFGLAAIVGLGASPAFAKNLTVGTCDHASYASVQTAVTAASAGDSIKVCPGNYQERVMIPAGKDNLKLKGSGQDKTSIQFPQHEQTLPSGPQPNAVLTVNGSKNVEVSHLTIEGPWTDNTCNSQFVGFHYGIYVEGGGQARIHDSHVHNIEDAITANNVSCFDGIGIEVGYPALVTPAQTGTADIQNDLIDGYAAIGVEVTNSGSSAVVEHNAVIGQGPGYSGGPIDGIEVDSGATGSVQDNTVTNNQLSGAAGSLVIGFYNDLGTGIKVFAVTGGVTVQDNKLSANDAGISLGEGKQFGGDVSPTSGVQVQHNQVSGSLFIGLLAQDDAMLNTFHDNQATDTATGAAHYDCEDLSSGGGTAGTADTWKNNKGATANPAAICKSR